MITIKEIVTSAFFNDLVSNNAVPYQVGGSLRDEFLGKESKDVDIVITQLPLERIVYILSKYGKVNQVGVSFGVIKFKPKGYNEDIDFSLPRTEKKTGVGHHGFEITSDHTLPIEKDLERRDIRINSIAKNLVTGELVDPFNGVGDIKAKIIALTNPQAFKDDPLRMLRVIGFASRFNFNIEPATLSLIKSNAKSIREISPERILIELDKIVKKGDPGLGVKLLVETGLFYHIFRDIGRMNYFEVGQSTNMAEFIYTMLRRSCNFPSVFYKEVLKGDLDVYGILRAFEQIQERRLDTEFDKRKLVFDIFKTSPAAIQSFVVKHLFGLNDVIRTMIEQDIPLSFKDLSINGNDLIALGFKDKAIGAMLTKVRDAIYKDQLKNSKEKIINFIQNI